MKLSERDFNMLVSTVSSIHVDDLKHLLFIETFVRIANYVLTNARLQ